MPERKPVPSLADFMQPIRLREMLGCAERELERRRNLPQSSNAARKAAHDAEIILMRDIADYLRRDLEAP